MEDKHPLGYIICQLTRHRNRCGHEDVGGLHQSPPWQPKVARGERTFVMTMLGEEKVTNKVEKRSELITKARNMKLHLKDETL